MVWGALLHNAGLRPNDVSLVATEGGAVRGSLILGMFGLGAATVLVAGGAGDNAASGCGIGAIRPGEGFVSLGTSGVVFVCGQRFAPNPAQAVHAFCHALPGRWHQMSVMLSAASAVSWRFTCGPVSAWKVLMRR